MTTIKPDTRLAEAPDDVLSAQLRQIRDDLARWHWTQDAHVRIHDDGTVSVRMPFNQLESMVGARRLEFDRWQVEELRTDPGGTSFGDDCRWESARLYGWLRDVKRLVEARRTRRGRR